MPSAKINLFLHIGVHRTATTSIQRYLRAVCDTLLDNNVLIPNQRGRQLAWTQALRKKRIDARAIAREILSEIERENPHVSTIIYSEEDISKDFPPELFAGLSDYFNVRVVVFLRRQDLWLESWYLQNIKSQWDRQLSHATLSQFMEHWSRGDFHWIQYQSLVDAWAGIFGRENIILQTFDKIPLKGSPVKSFLDLTGNGDFYVPEKDLQYNSSATPQFSEFLRHLHMNEFCDPDESQIAARAATRASGKSANREIVLLDTPTRQQVLEYYADGNRAVAREFFHREELFDLTMPTSAVNWVEIKQKESLNLLQQVVDPFVRELLADANHWRQQAQQAGASGMATRPQYGGNYYFKMWVKSVYQSVAQRLRQ